MNTKNYLHISKTLSYLLRHDKTAPVEDGGWLSVDYITQSKGITKDEILLIVRKDAKKRFELNDDMTKVRALYGHSIKVNLSYDCKTPPEILYHGTDEDASLSILSTGLIPKSRRFVHLSTDETTARVVGSRRGNPVVLIIDASKMHKDGFLFYNPTSNTWLTERVPSNYIKATESSFSKRTKNIIYDKCNLERDNLISITCFSKEDYMSLKNDKILSMVCDIKESADIEHPIKIESLKDYFNSKLHFIYNGDHALAAKTLEEIRQLEPYTKGVVYMTSSPIESNEPYVLLGANDADSRNNAIRKICMLVEYDKWLVPFDYNDIHTSIFMGPGQIKISEYPLDMSRTDIRKICEQINKELTRTKFRGCLAQITIPESLLTSDYPIYGWDGEKRKGFDPKLSIMWAKSLMTELNHELSFIWGVSYNDVQLNPSITLFLH